LGYRRRHGWGKRWSPKGGGRSRIDARSDESGRRTDDVRGPGCVHLAQLRCGQVGGRVKPGGGLPPNDRRFADPIRIQLRGRTGTRAAGAPTGTPTPARVCPATARATEGARRFALARFARHSTGGTGRVPIAGCVGHRSEVNQLDRNLSRPRDTPGLFAFRFPR